MKLHQLLDELDNVIEQGTNDENITKVSVITAVTDLVREFRGDDLDFMFESDDHYDSFEETDFSDLKNSNVVFTITRPPNQQKRYTKI